MTLEEHLYALLHADTAVAALVADRIYPVEAEQGTGRPYLVFQRTDQASLGVLAGPGDVSVVQLAVLAYADSAEEARAVAAEARRVLQAARTTAGPFCSARLAGRSQQKLQDPQLYGDGLVFNVMARE